MSCQLQTWPVFLFLFPPKGGEDGLDWIGPYLFFILFFSGEFYYLLAVDRCTEYFVGRASIDNPPVTLSAAQNQDKGATLVHFKIPKTGTDNNRSIYLFVYLSSRSASPSVLRFSAPYFSCFSALTYDATEYTMQKTDGFLQEERWET